MAVPASAHGISKATITVGCGTQAQANQICVHITGDLEDVDKGGRHLVFDVYAADSSTSLGEIVFDVPASSGNPDQPVDLMKCFPAITTGTSFVVKLVHVTDASGAPSDFQFLANGAQTPFIDFDSAKSPPVQVGTAGACSAATSTPTPTPTPSGSGAGAASPTPTPTAATTLAQTGGLDARFPIAGLALLGAGLTLLVVSARRGRRRTGTE